MGHLSATQRSKDGCARRMGGFTIILGPPDFASRTPSVGVAVVARSMMQFAEGLKMHSHLCQIRQGVYKTEVFRALGLEQSLTRLSNRPIRIRCRCSF